MTKIERLNQGTVAALELHLVQLKQRLAEIDRLIATIEEQSDPESRYSTHTAVIVRRNSFYLPRCS